MLVDIQKCFCRTMGNSHAWILSTDGIRWASGGETDMQRVGKVGKVSEINKTTTADQADSPVGKPLQVQSLPESKDIIICFSGKPLTPQSQKRPQSGRSLSESSFVVAFGPLSYNLSMKGGAGYFSMIHTSMSMRCPWHHIYYTVPTNPI